MECNTEQYDDWNVSTDVRAGTFCTAIQDLQQSPVLPLVYKILQLTSVYQLHTIQL